jgi:hypothetical protein
MPQDDDVFRRGETAPGADDTGMDDGRVVFHYSRERRLSRASASVRAIYEEKDAPKKHGIFRTLTSTKPLTFSFLSILTICAIMFLYSFLNGGGTRRICDTEIGVQALVSGNQSYFTVKKTVRGKNPFTGEVKLIISAAADDGPVEDAKTADPPQAVLETLYFGLTQEETFRFIVPFAAKRFLALALLNDDAITFKVSPRRSTAVQRIR